MAHLRVHLSNEAFAQLRGLAGRSGRDVTVEASLQLEAALRGVAADRASTWMTIKLASDENDKAAS